ncbi:MAG: YfcE family phosphodiesterase [Firmicutes bacterium]|nr:YfcE family phosphodiesterase [Bacillota bacterium]
MEKLMAVSDIHGAYDAAEDLAQILAAERPDRLLLLGDVLRPAMNPVGREDLAALLNRLDPPPVAVRGNCDQEDWQDYFSFPILEPLRSLPWDGRLLFLSHGHAYGESFPPAGLRPGDVLLCGHSHVPKGAVHPGFVFLNPGSFGQPRGGSCHSYLILEKDEALWKDLSGRVFSRLALPPPAAAEQPQSATAYFHR